MHPETSFNLIAWAVTTLNTAAAGVTYVRCRRSRRTSPFSCVVSALFVAALMCLVEIVGLMGLAGPFGIIRIAQYNLAVPPALLGLAVLVDVWIDRGGSRAARIALGLALIAPGLVIGHAAFVAPYRLRIERTELPVEAAIPHERPIRVVVFSDLQTDRAGAYEHRAVDAALAERPDLILLPGDLFQVSDVRWESRKHGFRALIDRIRASHGVFAVLGNVDDARRTGPFLADTSVRLLNNQVELVEIRGVRVAIGGIGLHYFSAAAELAIDELARSDADVRILVSHMPDVLEYVHPDDGIDLIVAGHTHGGQVVIPGFGPPLTLSGVSRRIAAGGLQMSNGQQIYVSRGIGMERGNAPPVRFFCPPELSVLEFRSR